MNKLNNSFVYNRAFSHIYVETRAYDYKMTNIILDKFKYSKIIEVNHYKDVFSKSAQSFNIQKQSQKLILGVKTENFLYKGADVCQSFDHNNFYYTSFALNCVYNCEYCYLQGVYPSSYLVIFVNIEDFLIEINNILNNERLYLCISYDTDLLAFESVLGYCRICYNFTKRNNNIIMELRTKSSNDSFKALTYNERFIIGWTLSPDYVIDNFEHKTASLDKRIACIKKMIARGWKVRICIDPIIYFENFKAEYKILIDKIFSNIDRNDIIDVSIGVFRCGKDYLKKMQKDNENSILVNYPFVLQNGVYSYETKIKHELLLYLHNTLSNYLDDNKIFVK